VIALAGGCFGGVIALAGDCLCGIREKVAYFTKNEASEREKADFLANQH
jgi:hypothetical protein